MAGIQKGTRHIDRMQLLLRCLVLDCVVSNIQKHETTPSNTQMFWSCILVALLGVMCYHAFEMIVLHTYEYSNIYGGMVLGNVAYAALLCLILCNVMPKDESKSNTRVDFGHDSDANLISDKSDKSQSEYDDDEDAVDQGARV